MARIGENAFRQYRDGQDRLTAPEYMAERELIRLAVNDLDDKIQRTEGIREEFTNTVNEVSAVRGEVVQTKQEVETRIGEFSQTIDQTTQQLQQAKEEVQEISTQLTEKVYYANTVADMLDKAYTIGDTVQTLGYFSTNDNGGNTYNVLGLQSEPKSYDIVKGALIFRPTPKGIINPRMFGTVADGTNADNISLQKCFDYAYENKISNIDGLGLLYRSGTVDGFQLVIGRTDSGTEPLRYGPRVRSGVTLNNFNIKTMDGATNFTNCLIVLMNENPIEFNNCVFDGNRINVRHDTSIGNSDGGLHGIIFIPDSNGGLWAKEFIPVGNVYFRNCTVKDASSYGIAVAPLDCRMEVRDCNFDVYGIALQAHVTDLYVYKTKGVMGAARSGMVNVFFHQEIEFSNNYTGTKKPNVLIEECDVTKRSSVTGFPPLFKAHFGPAKNMNYGTIISRNNKLDGCADIELYNANSTVLYIDKIVSEGNKKGTRESGRIGITCYTNTGVTKYINISSVVIRDNEANYHTLRGLEIGELLIENQKLDGSLLTINYSNIQILEINNMQQTIEQLGSFGIFRDDNGFVKKLIGSNIRLLDSVQYFFTAKIEEVELSNIYVKGDSTGKIPQLLMLYSTPNPKKVKATNVLLEGSRYDSGYYFLTTSNADATTDGFIYLNTVNHLSNVTTPPISSKITKKKLSNSDNLF